MPENRGDVEMSSVHEVGVEDDMGPPQISGPMTVQQFKSHLESEAVRELRKLSRKREGSDVAESKGSNSKFSYLETMTWVGGDGLSWGSVRERPIDQKLPGNEIPEAMPTGTSSRPAPRSPGPGQEPLSRGSNWQGIARYTLVGEKWFHFPACE